MKVLVIGGGGREHALAWKLKQCERVHIVFVAPGNGGTAADPGLRNVPITDPARLADFAAAEKVALTVVGPEAPLAAGVVDLFRARGLRIFGPTQAAAQLESSKAFAKEFMQRHGIPTALYATFTDAGAAHAHVDRHGAPIVVKADGLAADKLMNSPRLYATFLLWMLSELFEMLPEVGDLDKPKLVFFFDEAHLLFNDAPKALIEKIELVVRLVRSKGVGVYFVTQNPLDVPDTVLAQLANRVQHALRAFTPRDQKAVKAAAETMRPNPKIGDMAAAITELAVGEALVSFLDAKGRPSVTERVFVLPPGSQIGPITPAQRKDLIASSLVAGTYEKTVDRESAHEILRGRAEAPTAGAAGGARDGTPRTPTIPGAAPAEAAAFSARPSWRPPRGPVLPKMASFRPSSRPPPAASAVRSMGSAVGRELIRGVLGSLLGGSKRR